MHLISTFQGIAIASAKIFLKYVYTLFLFSLYYDFCSRAFDSDCSSFYSVQKNNQTSYSTEAKTIFHCVIEFISSPKMSVSHLTISYRKQEKLLLVMMKLGQKCQQP